MERGRNVAKATMWLGVASVILCTLPFVFEYHHHGGEDHPSSASEQLTATGKALPILQPRSSPSPHYPNAVFDPRYPHIQMAMCRDLPYPHGVIVGAVAANTTTTTNAAAVEKGTSRMGSKAVIAHLHEDVSLVPREVGTDGITQLLVKPTNGRARVARTLQSFCGEVTNAKLPLIRPSLLLEGPKDGWVLPPNYYARRVPTARPLPHLRVLAFVPSPDIKSGHWRRSMLRRTWLRYHQNHDSWKYRGEGGVGEGSEVKRDKDPQMREQREEVATAMFLVRFVLGRHPEHSYRFSDAVLSEADAYRDVVFLEMREGAPTSKSKQTGFYGHWGMETEIGMSRKALYWHVLAQKTYSYDFAMKIDDDSFLRVPQYLLDLEHVVMPFAAAMSGAPIAGSEDAEEEDTAAVCGEEEHFARFQTLAAHSMASFRCGSSSADSVFGDDERRRRANKPNNDLSNTLPTPRCDEASSLMAARSLTHPARRVTGVYWGGIIGKPRVAMGKRTLNFALGQSFTLSADLVEATIDDGVLYSLSGTYMPMPNNVSISDWVSLQARGYCVAEHAALLGKNRLADAIRICEDKEGSITNPSEPYAAIPHAVPGDYYSYLAADAYRLYRLQLPSPSVFTSDPIYWDSSNYLRTYKWHYVHVEDMMQGLALDRYADRLMDAMAREEGGASTSEGGTRGTGSKVTIVPIAARLWDRAATVRKLPQCPHQQNGDGDSSIDMGETAYDGAADHITGNFTNVSPKRRKRPTRLQGVNRRLGQRYMRRAGILMVDDRRFHDLKGSRGSRIVTRTSLVTHHVRSEGDYLAPFERFAPHGREQCHREHLPVHELVERGEVFLRFQYR